MGAKAKRIRTAVAVLVAGLAGLLGAEVGLQASCEAPNVGGTVELPALCPYISPDEVFMIIDGLPVGTTIELEPEWGTFTGRVEAPGGDLGGEVQTFDSTMVWQATGTGDLAGFNRTLFVPLAVEAHSGPRTPGDAVQPFDTKVESTTGGIVGDPDFDALGLTAGDGNGLPSPGITTLTRLGAPGSDFEVDSFFDITYEIDFVGAPGSVLDGMEGTTVGTIRMTQVPEPATLALVGTGLVGLWASRRRRERSSATEEVVG